MHALLLAAVLNWNLDIAHLSSEMRKMHPNPSPAVIRELDALRTRADALPPHEAVVELARVVALAGDGHTRVTFPVEGFFQGHSKTAPAKVPQFRTIPVRFTIFDDGPIVTRAADATLIGKKLTRIGTMSIDDAIAAVMPVVHGDNESQKREILAGYLTMLDVLHARRVIASFDEVPLAFDDGSTVTLKPAALEPLPPKKPFSFRKTGNTVIFDFVEVANMPDKTLARFAEEMFREVDGKLIIDLRENWGGNGSLNRSIIHEIIRSKPLQTPGNLLVLTGRRTFSAAIMFMLELEKHTNAILIGEPTGGKPNSYGDSRKVVLPHSNLTVRISTLYWQLSDPRDKRTTIVPHIAAHPTAHDFRANRDAAMDLALDYFGGAPSADVSGDWKGTIAIEHHRFPFTLRDGRITAPDLELSDVALNEVKGMTFDLRAGSKRLAGMLRTNGLEFLVTGERQSSP